MPGTTVTWLAVRELWITFRFLGLLVAGLAAGLAVTVAQPGITDGLRWLAWGTAATGVVAAAAAGATLAVERRRGRVAWLAVRAVARSGTLLAWFMALALPPVAGLAVSGLLAWLVAASASALAPVAFGALVVAAGIFVLEALAVGLLAGTLLRPAPAALAGAMVAAGLAGLGLLAGGAEPALSPVAGIGLLAGALSLLRPLSDGLVASGIGLATAGLLLAAAAALLERADL